MKPFGRPRLTRQQVDEIINLLDRHPDKFQVRLNGLEVESTNQLLTIKYPDDRPIIRVRSGSEYTEAEIGFWRRQRMKAALRRWAIAINLEKQKKSVFAEELTGAIWSVRGTDTTPPRPKVVWVRE